MPSGLEKYILSCPPLTPDEPLFPSSLNFHMHLSVSEGFCLFLFETKPCYVAASAAFEIILLLALPLP